ncbi:uncharacterized protein LOC135348820 [Halichondria panicea]|uniref:uncharacterized protein LOC135348820 n=1 Tax=Halichondria panicea TaxID=6063 RepID=UPI00312B7709
MAHGYLLTLELLESAFGPQGLKVLSDSPQKQTLCSSGKDFIDEFKQVNPLLTRAAEQTNSLVGDGVKRFLLISMVALLQAKKESSGSHYREILLQVSKHLGECDVLTTSIVSGKTSIRNVQKVVFNLKKSLLLTPITDKNALRSTCLKLIMTSFGNGCSYMAKRRLKEILTEMLFPQNSPPCLAEMKEHIRNCLAALSFNHLLHVPLSVMETRVAEGFLLDSNLLSEPQLASGESVITALLLSGLDLESAGACVEIRNRSQLQQVVHFQERFTNRVVQYLVQNNVRLLLCSGKLSAGSLHTIRGSHIGVVQLIPGEVLVSIAEVNHTYPFSNAVEMIRSGNSSSLIMVKCSSMDVGRKRYTLLQTSSLSGTSADPYALILCAPTLAQCHTVMKLMRRALRVVENWLRSVSENNELVCVLGGGVWEVELVREMKNYISTKNLVRGSPEWIAVDSLIQAFLSVPQALYCNTLPPTRRRSAVVKKLLHHNVFDTSDESLVGIDIIKGCVVNVEASGVSVWSALEPAWSTHYLFASVCKFLAQALRVDNTVSVPRLVTESLRELSPDSED